MDRSMILAIWIMLCVMALADRAVHYLTGYSPVYEIWQHYAPQMMLATGD